jgi:sugar phosphate isomerase/epimerase
VGGRDLRDRLGIIVGYQCFMPEDDPLDSIDFARGLGMELVELNANMPWLFPERFDRGRRASMRSKAARAGVLLAVHAPEEISFVSPHEALLEAGLRRATEYVDFAADIGAGVLTCHLGGGYLRWATGDNKVLFPHQLYPDRMRESLMQTLPDLARYAKGKGVKLSIENAGCFGPAIIQEFVEELLGTSPLYLTWDAGHSNTRDGQLDRHERFFFSHMDRIALIHLHDNDGTVDSHSPLGSGTLDLPRVLSVARRARVPVSMEVRPRSLIPQCVNALLDAPVVDPPY